MKKILRAKWIKNKGAAINTYLGVYIPYGLAEYIAVYCLANKVNKSELIREIVTNWSNCNDQSVHDLLVKIRQRVQEEWNLIRAKENLPVNELQIRFDSYLMQIYMELTQYGIAPDFIVKILNKVKLNDRT